MRYAKPVAYVALGLVLSAGVYLLGFYATGDDSYYPGSHVSRWEHASRGNGVARVLAGLLLASAAALACLARGLAPKLFAFTLRWLPIVAAYVVAVWLAWFPLTAGH